VEGANGAAQRKPLVGVTEENYWLFSVVAKDVYETFHLMAPLISSKAKVGYNDAHNSTANIEHCINDTTGLTAGDTQIYQTNLSNGIASEQDIAIIAIRSLYSWACYSFQPRGLGQILHLRIFKSTPGFGFDLLQSYYLGVNFVNDSANPSGITPTVRADALMNIVRRNREGINLPFCGHTVVISFAHLSPLPGLNPFPGPVVYPFVF
jgi:hypothetical protein